MKSIFINCFVIFFLTITGCFQYVSAQNQLEEISIRYNTSTIYKDSIHNILLLSRLYRESNGKKALEFDRKCIEMAKKIETH